MKCKEKTRLFMVPREHRQSYREWHNALRIRQMAKVLRDAGANLTDASDVHRALHAANFSEDCIERLAGGAALAAGPSLSANAA